MNTDVFLTYLDFVVERHRIWEKRQAGEPGPWTDDPILRARKFTNDFRVLDHGSQFLLTELLNTAESPADALARAFLYRMTNRTEVWERSKDAFGDYPHVYEMTSALAEHWCALRDTDGVQVFSGAYIIMPEPGVKGVDKVRSVVKLAEAYFNEESPTNIVESFLAGEMEDRFKLLRTCPGIGPFIAMQVLTDYGYSPFGADQDENDFVSPGPGCIKGAKEIDHGRKPADMIRFCRDAVLSLEDCPTLVVEESSPPGFPQLRPPSLMDIQNTLCEFSKYARYMRKPDKLVPYSPAHPGAQPAPVLPRHWAL